MKTKKKYYLVNQKAVVQWLICVNFAKLLVFGIILGMNVFYTHVYVCINTQFFLLLMKIFH